MLHCSIAESSSSEELSVVSADLSSRASFKEGMERKKSVTQNKILPLQADPVILNENIGCIIPNTDTIERNTTLSCCTGRKVRDRTGVRHRLLHLEHPSEWGNNK